MLERVLSDLRRPLLPMRIETMKVGHWPSPKFDNAPCLWDDFPPWPEEKDSNSLGDWYLAQNPHIPQGRSYNGELKEVQKTVSMNGETIQCIVKLANIVLMPLTGVSGW